MIKGGLWFECPYTASRTKTFYYLEKKDMKENKQMNLLKYTFLQF